MENFRVSGTLSQTPTHRLAPNMENFQFFLGLRSVQLGKMRLQPSGLTLFPVLFEVESQRQKKQLGPHILFASCEESAETKVVLQKAKGTFHLDRTAKPEIDAFLCGDVRLGDRPLLLVLLADTNLFRLVCILGLAALTPPRAASAILAAVMADHYIVFAVLVLALADQGKCFPNGTGICIRILIIGHILHSAYLAAVFLRFSLFMVHADEG